MTRALAIALCALGCDGGEPTAAERALLGQLHLGPLPPDPTNAVADDERAAALGRQLFFDPRYSGPLLVGDDGSNGGLGAAGESGRIACASCHDPAQGGSDHRSPGATSLGAAWGARNAPTVVNAARAEAPWRFWDGRADSLWSQALGPIEHTTEMNSSRQRVAQLIVDHYRAPYEALFGTVPSLDDAAGVDVLFANFGKAIAAYERTLVDQASPFDRWLDGDASALTAAAVRGARLFVGRASCNECHRGPLLSDGKFHNHAIPQPGAEDRGRYDGIPEVLADPFNGAGAYADQQSPAHLAGLTPGPLDLGAFKTPTLRNVARTAPYMHTGGFRTLWDVLVWYRDAAGTDGYVGTRDPAVQPLRLSDDDLNDLAAFLQALDGEGLPEALPR